MKNPLKILSEIMGFIGNPLHRENLLKILSSIMEFNETPLKNYVSPCKSPSGTLRGTQGPSRTSQKLSGTLRKPSGNFQGTSNANPLQDHEIHWKSSPDSRKSIASSAK
jgi:hypothetical protein